MTIETKYDIGQEVWVMSMNRPHCAKITGIRIEKHGLFYNIEYLLSKREEQIFPTKEELLKSL